MTIQCEVTKTKFQIKKTCKIAEMPKNAKYYHTIYISSGMQDVYYSNSGIFYATPLRLK